MYYSYFELDEFPNNVFIVELSYDDPMNIKNVHLKMYGLDVYYVKNDDKVIYPLVYEGNIKLDKECYFRDQDLCNQIVKAIVNGEHYFNYDLDNPRCDLLLFDDKYFYEESIIEKVCENRALNSIPCVYDINVINESTWTVRRNGQLIGKFDPKEFEKYYNPLYDGDDRFCYLGDAIIVDNIDGDIYAINRVESNYLSYKLHNLGVMWLVEHGHEPPKYDI